MGVIYKITNLINGKIYIGQTIVPEPVRWQQHIFNANHNPNNDCSKLCNAINKYGRENFKREILETVKTKEELNEREKFYIELYNSTDDTIGYNICLGGDSHLIYKDEDIIKAYEKTKSTIQTAKLVGAHPSCILNRLKALNLYYLPTTVLQYNLKGDLLNTFESFAQAKRDTGLPLPKLIPSHNYTCGYVWVYKKDDVDVLNIINKIINNDNLKKPYLQYDLEGNFVRKWESAAEASRELNLDVSSIKAAARGDQITAGKYIWVKKDSPFTFEEKYENYLLSSSCCEIEEIDKEGNVIQKYQSANQAEKILGLSYNEVKLVCDGITSNARGRYFRYSNPVKRELLKLKRLNKS